jgi:dTDP-4-dehydrorhamnose 3,5-epimerase
MIDGVVVKQLSTHGDERGFFRELIRVTDGFFGEGFGQLSHAVVYPGVAKAWHIHQRQVDWWYVAAGIVKVALHDTRSGSPTIRQTTELLMGDHQDACVLRIPPGVAHGYRCIQGPAHVLYLTSTVYDGTDEGRISHDDPTIGYDWLRGPPIR